MDMLQVNTKKESLPEQVTMERALYIRSTRQLNYFSTK